MNKAEEFFKKRGIEVIKNDSWLKEAQWRKNNKYWLLTSTKIALKLLDYKEQNNITDNEFAKFLDIDVDNLKKYYKGKYDFKLSELLLIKNKLNINIEL